MVGTGYAIDAFGEVMAEGGAGLIISSQAAYMHPIPNEIELQLVNTPTEQLANVPFVKNVAMQNSGLAYMIAKRMNHLQAQHAAATTWRKRRARMERIVARWRESRGRIAELESRRVFDFDRRRNSAVCSRIDDKRSGTGNDRCFGMEEIDSPVKSDRAAYPGFVIGQELRGTVDHKFGDCRPAQTALDCKVAVPWTQNQPVAIAAVVESVCGSSRCRTERQASLADEHFIRSYDGRRTEEEPVLGHPVCSLLYLVRRKRLIRLQIV